jgi:4,4'-diaponeurosporenoate glycosyltransferase
MEQLAIWRALFLFSSLAYWPVHLHLFSRLDGLDGMDGPKGMDGLKGLKGLKKEELERPDRAGAFKPEGERGPRAGEDGAATAGMGIRDRAAEERSSGDAAALVPESSEFPSVSVVIPARNEADHISPLVKSLKQLDPAPGEIIVVDDDSRDGTGDLARGAGAIVIRSFGPPEGWTGKNHACHVGSRVASGEFLLFLDADVELSFASSAASSSATVASSSLLWDLYLRFLRESPEGGLISLQPWHRTKRFYEEFSLFFNLVAIAGSRDFGIFRNRRNPAGAFGPLLFTDRATYRGLDGHRAIAGEVVDDLALCRLYRSKGLGVRNYVGRGLVSFRMYPRGMGQLIEGWTKNMASGAGMAGGGVLLLLVFWITGMVNAFLAPLSLFWGWSAPYGIVSLAALSLWLASLYISARRIGSFSPLAVLLYPLQLLFFTAIVLRSFVLTRFLHRVSWRGRSIRVGERISGKEDAKPEREDDQG